MTFIAKFMRFSLISFIFLSSTTSWADDEERRILKSVWQRIYDFRQTENGATFANLAAAQTVAEQVYEHVLQRITMPVVAEDDFYKVCKLFIEKVEERADHIKSNELLKRNFEKLQLIDGLLAAAITILEANRNHKSIPDVFYLPYLSIEERALLKGLDYETITHSLDLDHRRNALKTGLAELASGRLSLEATGYVYALLKSYFENASSPATTAILDVLLANLRIDFQSEMLGLERSYAERNTPRIGHFARRLIDELSDINTEQITEYNALKLETTIRVLGIIKPKNQYNWGLWHDFATQQDLGMYGLKLAKLLIQTADLNAPSERALELSSLLRANAFRRNAFAAEKRGLFEGNGFSADDLTELDMFNVSDLELSTAERQFLAATLEKTIGSAPEGVDLKKVQLFLTKIKPKYSGARSAKGKDIQLFSSEEDRTNLQALYFDHATANLAAAKAALKYFKRSTRALPMEIIFALHDAYRSFFSKKFKAKDELNTIGDGIFQILEKELDRTKSPRRFSLNDEASRKAEEFLFENFSNYFRDVSDRGQSPDAYRSPFAQATVYVIQIGQLYSLLDIYHWESYLQLNEKSDELVGNLNFSVQQLADTASDHPEYQTQASALLSAINTKLHWQFYFSSLRLDEIVQNFGHELHQKRDFNRGSQSIIEGFASHNIGQFLVEIPRTIEALKAQWATLSQQLGTKAKIELLHHYLRSLQHMLTAAIAYNNGLSAPVPLDRVTKSMHTKLIGWRPKASLTKECQNHF